MTYFVYGVPPEKLIIISFQKGLFKVHFKVFMAAKGDEFGKGSFDKTSVKLKA